MNDSVESGGFVEASSGLLLLFSLGAVSGSLAGSVAMDLMGPAGLFSFTAAVHGGLAVFALARMRLRPSRADRAAPAAPLVSEPAAGLGPAAVPGARA